MRAGSPNAAQTFGCSSPAWPNSASPTNSRRSGRGATASAAPASTRTSTPSAAPSSRTTSTASAQLAARPGPHQPARSRSPASTAARVQRLVRARRRRAWPAPPSSGRRSTGRIGAAEPGRERDRCRSRTAPAPARRDRRCGRRSRAAPAAASWCTQRLLGRTAGWPAGRCGAARRRRAARARRSGRSPTNGNVTTSTQPGSGQRAADPAAQPLAHGSGRGRTGRRREHRRDVRRSRRSGRPPRPGRRGRSGRGATRRQAVSVSRSRRRSTAQPTARRCATVVSASIGMPVIRAGRSVSIGDRSRIAGARADVRSRRRSTVPPP